MQVLQKTPTRMDFANKIENDSQNCNKKFAKFKKTKKIS